MSLEDRAREAAQSASQARAAAAADRDRAHQAALERAIRDHLDGWSKRMGTTVTGLAVRSFDPEGLNSVSERRPALLTMTFVADSIRFQVEATERSTDVYLQSKGEAFRGWRPSRLWD
jgi:hypothetical protein